MPETPVHILQVSPASYTRDGIIGGGERLALYVDAALHLAANHAGLPVTTTLLALDGGSADGHGKAAIAGRAWDVHSLDADELTRRLRPADVVYVNQCLTPVGMFAAAHARLLGKRVFGTDSGGGDMRLLAHNPDAITVYDAVHAVSAFAASAFEGLPVAVHVIPGPVDTVLHRPPPEGAPARDPLHVVSIGRILPHKGHERTIRALPPAMRLTIIGQHYDTAYLDFLRSCAEGHDVVFDDTLDDNSVRAVLHRAGTVVQASSHVDYTGHFAHKPELLGLAPLEALASGAPTLVSDAAALPELGVLPGCRVFHDDAELAAMLRGQAAGQFAVPDAAEMHAAVDRRYGPAVVGAGLLAMMGLVAPCES
jgi:glycosyltransferase involved in cell wall biosynthesis